MDEDEPEISLALGKLSGEDEAIVSQSMTKHYKDNNELPYRWRYISPFNTLQERYKFENDITIKAEPIARRKKKALIYIRSRDLTKRYKKL